MIDACAPVTLTSNATGAELASITGASALWTAAGATGLAEAMTDHGARIAVAFVSSPPGVYGFYDDAEMMLEISDALADDERTIVIAHEVGHAFGLVHVPATERSSVMNAGNLVTAPDSRDRIALAALWGDCVAR